MKPSVNNLNGNQPKMLSKREDKKSVNHQWNHGLFFQIGLIVSLLLVLLVMESTIGYVLPEPGVAKDNTVEEPAIFRFEIEKAQPLVQEKQKPVKQKPIIKKPDSHKFEVKPNDAIVDETPTATTNPLDSEEPKVNPITTKPVEPANITKTAATVEFIPIFPGCEMLGTNAERRECMSAKVNAFVQRNFKTSKFENVLDNGKQKIYVQFKIDATGEVVDIAARSSHKLLEKEASRVISMLPKMKPGKQGDTNVSVLYSLPIVFQLD